MASLLFPAGFVALACLWAAAGSQAARTEDLSTTPLALTTALVGTRVLRLVGKGTLQVGA